MVNQFRPVTMTARTTPGTHNSRISAQTVTHRLRENGERPPYTMYVFYAAFLFWPSILYKREIYLYIEAGRQFLTLYFYCSKKKNNFERKYKDRIFKSFYFSLPSAKSEGLYELKSDMKL